MTMLKNPDARRAIFWSLRCAAILPVLWYYGQACSLLTAPSDVAVIGGWLMISVSIWPLYQFIARPTWLALDRLFNRFD